MTMTLTRPEVDEETSTGPGSMAHIVKVGPGENAAGAVAEARVFGTMIEALCGWKFTPHKDPSKLPMCAQCKEIFEMYRMTNGLDDPQV